jgi:predicted DNA-binding transcriptional regulator AlpA
MIADHRLGRHAHLLDEAGNTGPRPTRVEPIEEHVMTASPINPNENRGAMNPGYEMLTLQEACRFLRIPEGTLRYWRHLGCGPRSFKMGRHVRYWRADLILWLTEQTNRQQNHR